MEEKKILFTDIDGTLINDKKEVPKENMEAIKKALAAGHYVVIATGRPLVSGIMIAEKTELNMPGCYLIAYNGAVVYDFGKNKMIEEKTLSYDLVLELFRRAEQAGIYIQTYYKEQVVARCKTEELEAYCKHAKMDYLISDDIMEVLKEEPKKAMLIDFKEKEKLRRFRSENMDWQEGKCNSFFSTDSYLEYAPLGATKATGIHYLCEFLNIPLENTIAAGDERNDIPMIQEAHIGVAMQNAKAEIKEVADYVTKRTNNEGGIAEIIEKFMLQD